MTYINKCQDRSVSKEQLHVSSRQGFSQLLTTDTLDWPGRIVGRLIVHAGNVASDRRPYVVQVRLCTSPVISQPFCVPVHLCVSPVWLPVLLCSSPFVCRSPCVPVQLCANRVVYQSHSVLISLCTILIVYHSHCVPVSLCAGPLVYQSNRILIALCTSPTVC